MAGRAIRRASKSPGVGDRSRALPTAGPRTLPVRAHRRRLPRPVGAGRLLAARVARRRLDDRDRRGRRL